MFERTARPVAELYCASGTASGSLLDVRDPAAFVAWAIQRSGLQPTPGEREDLIAEGLALLCDLARRFEPQREDYDKPASLAGYAGRYLPPKLRDAASGLSSDRGVVRLDALPGGVDALPRGAATAAVIHDDHLDATLDRVGDPLDGASDALRSQTDELDRIAALAGDEPMRVAAVRSAVRIERCLRRDQPSLSEAHTGARALRALEVRLLAIQGLSVEAISARVGRGERTVKADTALAIRAAREISSPATALSATASGYPG